MKVSTSLIGLTVGLLVLLPGIASAEGTATGEADGTAVGTTPPSPSPTADAYSWGVNNVQTPPPGKGMGSGRAMNASGTPPRRPMEGMPRAVNASGTPIKPIMASGTRPLPPQMKEMMEHRDETRDQMMKEGRLNRPGATNTPDGRPMPAQMKERMQEAKERREENRGERMREFAERTKKRAEAAIDRLVKLTERIEARIAKIKASGKDTSEAESHIAKAKVAIDNAKAMLADAIAKAATFDPSTIASTSDMRAQPGMSEHSPMREPFKKFNDELKTAHQELNNAVKSLKGILGENKATTTSGTAN